MLCLAQNPVSDMLQPIAAYALLHPAARPSLRQSDDTAAMMAR